MKLVVQMRFGCITRIAAFCYNLALLYLVPHAHGDTARNEVGKYAELFLRVFDDNKVAPDIPSVAVNFSSGYSAVSVVVADFNNSSASGGNNVFSVAVVALQALVVAGKGLVVIVHDYKVVGVSLGYYAP